MDCWTFHSEKDYMVGFYIKLLGTSAKSVPIGYANSIYVQHSKHFGIYTFCSRDDDRLAA
jgi:hypothetical protein